MFKKIISIMVAVLMIASCAVVAVSAADTDDATVAADESGSVVSADEDSEASGAKDVISFKVPDDWKNVKVMYAHIWMCVDDGSISWPGWKTKSEKMDDNGDGTWSYDLSKLEKGAASIDPAKGVGYAVIFAADTGMQTYNLLMDSSCIGDTAEVTGNILENPEDSNKTCIEAKWQNAPYGAEKKITSSSTVIGTTLPEGSTDATLMAVWLKAYYGDSTKTGNTDSLLKTLGITGQEAYDELINISASMDSSERATMLEACAKLLGVDYNKGDEKKTSSGNGSATDSSSNGGSSTGNGSSSNGGSSTGSGSSSNGGSSSNSSSNNNGTASTGQDSTILFVLGGIMVAAAAVMFVTRRKKD